MVGFLLLLDKGVQMQDTSISYRAEEARRYGLVVAILLNNIRVFQEYHSQKSDGEYWHSMKDIAEATGVSTKQLSAAAKRAESLNLISYRQGYKPGTQTRTTYWSLGGVSQSDKRSTSEHDKRSTSTYNLKEINLKDCDTAVAGDSSVSKPIEPESSKGIKVDPQLMRQWYLTLTNLNVPVRNHTNTRKFAKKLQAEIGPEAGMQYLKWIRDNIPSDDPYCPNINTDSDLHAKRLQFRNYLNRGEEL